VVFVREGIFVCFLSPEETPTTHLPQAACLPIPSPGVTVDQKYLELTARKLEVPEEQGTYEGCTYRGSTSETD